MNSLISSVNPWAKTGERFKSDFDLNRAGFLSLDSRTDPNPNHLQKKSMALKRMKVQNRANKQTTNLNRTNCGP